MLAYPVLVPKRGQGYKMLIAVGPEAIYPDCMVPGARFFCLLVSCCVFAGTCSGSNVEITNFDFETPVLAQGAWTTNSIPGWTGGPTGYFGVYHVAPWDYPSGPPSGSNVAFVNGATVSQLLNASVVEHATYFLSFSVGRWSGPQSYTAALATADGQVLTSLTESTAIIPQNSFATRELTYFSEIGDPNLGKQLKIVVSSTGSEVDFDQFQLTYHTPEPEPSTLLLVGLSGVFVVSRARRTPAAKA